MVKARIVLVGDSDIAFWPKELLPSLSNHNAGEGGIEISDPTLVSGHSGATLAGVVPHLRTALDRAESTRTRTRTDESWSDRDDALVIVACAGENDIPEGLSLEKSVGALREFLDAVFSSSGDDNDNDNDEQNRYLVFLGPKFEPWLEDEPPYKKQYSAMARAFGRCLQEYELSESSESTTATTATATSTATGGSGIRIRFVDCLTMFCGETASVPGARLGGRARADPTYFASDRMHLGKEGYSVWKGVVEREIQGLLLAAQAD